MNDSENKAKKLLEENGWEVLRNGWPDFLCGINTTFGRRYVGVEIKTGTDRLSPEQRFMRSALESVGLPVYVIRPDQFEAPDYKPKKLVNMATREELLEDVFYTETRLKEAQRRLNAIEEEITAAKGRLNAITYLFERAE